MTASIANGVLTLSIPLDAEPQLSSTGRSHILASTRGWTKFVIGGEKVNVSLTVVRPLRQQSRSEQAAAEYDGGGE